jgi:Lipase (class 2)
VLSETWASKVDLVGHSQGGMMPRYYLNFLGGASKVNDFVALAPSNYGTTLDGLTELASLLGVTSEINGPLSSACEACLHQEVGSAFLANLNAAPTVAGVHYTVIESADDEVVTPYTNAFLPAAGNVTDIKVQNQCALDGSDHLEIRPTRLPWPTRSTPSTRRPRCTSRAWSCCRSLVPSVRCPRSDGPFGRPASQAAGEPRRR